MTSEMVAAGAGTGDRGRTVIDDRVREQLVERAALSVTGVVSRRTLVPGRTLPAVTISDARGAPAVGVQIAAAWPVDGAAVLERVRSEVVRELVGTLGEHPERVDVTVARVEADRTPAQVADAYSADPQYDPVAAQHRRFAPRRAAGATYTGVLVALLVVAAGVVAIRDAFTSADPWIAPALRTVTELQWQWWVWPAAIVAAVIGIALLIVAVKPRRRTHVSVGDHVWVPAKTARQWSSADADSIQSRGEVS